MRNKDRKLDPQKTIGFALLWTLRLPGVWQNVRVDNRSSLQGRLCLRRGVEMGAEAGPSCIGDGRAG